MTPLPPILSLHFSPPPLSGSPSLPISPPLSGSPSLPLSPALPLSRHQNRAEDAVRSQLKRQ